jgi:hypothetical protein
MNDSKKNKGAEDMKDIAKGRLVIRVRTALTAGLRASSDCTSNCECHSSCNCHSGGSKQM